MPLTSPNGILLAKFEISESLNENPKDPILAIGMILDISNPHHRHISYSGEAWINNADTATQTSGRVAAFQLRRQEQSVCVGIGGWVWEWL